MRNDDQWFEPGDKVMRVSNEVPPSVPGVRYVPLEEARPEEVTLKGKVFCVVNCWECPFDGRPTMHLAGFGVAEFLTKNFRKVEEIQLCVRAAEAMKTPKKQEELV